MSRVIEQGRCEFCGSSDAGTHYEDGGFYCFSCRKGYRGSAVVGYRSHKTNITEGHERIEFPPETIGYIPEIAQAWLDQYDLTKKELSLWRWTSHQEMLIYPVYQGQTLTFWQGRYFPARMPKTHNKGDLRGLPHVIEPGVAGDRLIVVEDVVSALKVGRHVDCLCMFGSSVRMEWLPWLRKRYKHVSLWFDYDKRKQAVAVKSRLNLLFPKTDIIVTERDPKEYSNEELIRWLNLK